MNYDRCITTIGIICWILLALTAISCVCSITMCGRILAENPETEDGWYEAIIFCDGEEIIRGQISDYKTSGNMTRLYFTDGNEWIVYNENFILQYHLYNN